ncbi:MAG: hypothetical protein GYA51_06525 [Candidatus Methanofastidiosa archaeon]|nr:hypothetical protein [Candidatus Methanofastidiosa archaeon]
MRLSKIILLFIVFISYSCGKEKDVSCDTGSIKVYNYTGFPIYVVIGSEGSGINDGGYFSYTGSTGPIEVLAKAMTGDINSPWSYFSSEIIGCQNTNFPIYGL